MKSVTSSAAVAKLTVSDAELKGDYLLQWIIQIATPLRLAVVTKPKASLCLELLASDGLQLTHRNAIIRCLCGMGLHNALDTTASASHLTMGGHSAAVGASPYHAMAIASISSWMSVADHARKTKDSVDSLLSQLESHLTTRAFLVPSSQCTIADVDVALALLQSKGKEGVSGFPNVQRWLNQCCASIEAQGVSLPASMSMDDGSKKQIAPIFFIGTEEVVLPTKKPQQQQSQSKGDQKKGQDNKQKQQNNQQKQQKQQQQEQGKKQKKQQQQQQQAPADAAFNVSALDIRVGQIKKVWHHPEAEKLFCEEIDIGEESGPRQIASGLRPFYQTSDLENRRVVVLCNLKKRNLVGFPSHGMVLCASNADHTQVECMEPPPNAKIGERVLFEGFQDGAPEPENKIAKKKIFEEVAPDLKTNADGICVWKGAISITSDGPIKASKGMPNAQVS